MTWGASVTGGSPETTPTAVSGLSDIVSVAVSSYAMMALKNDGTLYAWGDNAYGQFGDGVPGVHGSPTAILTNVVAVATGDQYTLALKNDGSLWATGDNTYGVLGDGTTTSSTVFQQISNVLGAAQIRARGNFALVLKSDGTLTSWGKMGPQLGLGSGGGFILAPAPIGGINLLGDVPTCSITSPSSPATGILGVNLNLQVSTSDSYGTVTQVDFYNERTLIGSSTSYPFSLPWSPHTWGTFHITAVALDDLGAVSLRSDVLTVTFPCDLDSNGLPDDWEIDKFGHVGNSGSADFDGDALTNLYEYQHGSDPTNYYSQGSVTVVPVVTIISGDGQDGGKGYFADAPLVVKVTNSSGGAALNKAPVTFTVISGGGLVFDATYNSGSAITVQTGSDGNAQVFYCQPETDNTTSTITASSAGQSVTFTESTSLGDGNFDPPTAPTVDSINSTQFALSWENHATAADFILVQERANGGAWSTIATFTDITTTNYTVTGLSPGVIYEYRIVAGQN